MWKLGDKARVRIDGRVGRVVHIFPGKNSQTQGTVTLAFHVEGTKRSEYREGFTATQLEIVC